jgi:diguanylate cyclase (GGDEF)-like protein
VLVVYAHQEHDNHLLAPGVYAGSGVLIALVLARQVVAILENRQLYQSLHAAYQELRASHGALATANARLENLATTDPLTDLPNHRAMVAALDLEIERARRFGRPCAILFLDLDHFKALNDGYGHQAGDAVLREFATLVRAALRGIDTVGRWGGEEFVAILPETEWEAALIAAEHVRTTVGAHRFIAGGTHLTCSIGVAAYPSDGEDRDTLVAAADQAMYWAKCLGRNQARAACDPVAGDLRAESDRAGSREDMALAGTVEALAALVEARDRYSDEHSLDIADLATQIALACGLPAAEARMIGLAGRLCDLGKVAVPDAVLRKPARLTDGEWQQIRRHPLVGEDVANRVPALRVLAPLIRAHHERWDGQGYPDGLCGEAIPLGARIVAVAAAFRAMTTDRPYKQARDRIWSIAELRRCAGTQFDPSVVGALDLVLHQDAAATERLQAG